MQLMSDRYRREYISELCDRLVPLLNIELEYKDMECYHEATKDLACRLSLASDWFRQCKKPSGENEKQGEENAEGK